MKKWIDFITRFKRKPKTTSSPNHNSIAANPYLQSRAMWNELYGNLQIKLENCYRIVFILSVALIISMISLIVIAGESKVKSVPFIVHGDDLLTLTNEQQLPAKQLHSRLSFYFIKQFIAASRAVSADGVINSNNTIKAYALSQGEATGVLKAYYEKNDPNALATHKVRDIEITSLLRESKSTIDVRWFERLRDVHTGLLIKKTPYIARISYQYQKPSTDQTILHYNPLGFVITYLSWSVDNHA
ncbi:MAG: type IV secretion system protein [Coxiellaceae bacterium]|nr:type IV secretion system protein [Coxiellaceae bacterium]